MQRGRTHGAFRIHVRPFGNEQFDDALAFVGRQYQGGRVEIVGCVHVCAAFGQQPCNFRVTDGDRLMQRALPPNVIFFFDVRSSVQMLFDDFDVSSLDSFQDGNVRRVNFCRIRRRWLGFSAPDKQ